MERRCNRAGQAAHSQALREYLAKGMSYSEIADAINAKFGTAYSRSAAIGRARRMGLAGPDRPPRQPRAGAEAGAEQPKASRLASRVSVMFPNSCGRYRPSNAVERPKLRCVEIVPRHLSLVDLEPGDCRYPYGGDEEGEAITFCGHPQQEGSSYCAPHFHLTRDPEQPVGTGSRLRSQFGWWRRHE